MEDGEMEDGEMAETAAHQDKAEIAHPNARFLPYRNEFHLTSNRS